MNLRGDNAKLNVFGTVIADFRPVYIEGANSQTFIGTEGSLIGRIGYGATQAATLTNAGEISGFSTGVQMEGDSTFTNSGVVSGHFHGASIYEQNYDGIGSRIINDGQINAAGNGLSVDDPNSRITNTGLIKGNAIGVYLGSVLDSGGGSRDAGLGGSYHLTNSGTIVGMTAIRGSVMRDVVVNTGIIDGNVTLNDGSDHYDGRSGVLTGELDLGTGNDTAFGGELAEYIYGGSGADYIDGGGGDDRLSGGDGHDIIKGGSGGDQIDAGSGDNAVDGGADDDIIRTYGGRDTILGGEGNDVIIGGGGADWVDGGDGNDVIKNEGNSLNDTMHGGAGDDTIDAGEGNNTVDGGADHDSITTWAGDDTIRGGTGDDTIDAGNGRNLLDGGEGNDTITTWIGSNTIFGGAGNDRIFDINTGVVDDGSHNYVDAGEGNDYVSIQGRSGNDTVLGGAGSDTIDAGEGDNEIDGGADNDRVKTWAGNDTVYGGHGNDTLDAGDGHNLVEGGDGNDRIKTWLGNDTLEGGAGHDVLDAGEGNNVLDGGDGNDILLFGRGNNTLIGGDGTDTIAFEGSADMVVSLGRSVQSPSSGGKITLIGIENIATGSGNDRLTGNSLANTLQGNAGSDILDGGLGDDVLDGGRTDGDNDWAVFNGNIAANVDLTILSAQATGYGNDTLIDIESLLGSAKNDVFKGDARSNWFNGQGGNDKLDGGDGIDTVVFSGTAGAKVNLATTKAQNTGYGKDTIVRIENATGGAGKDVFTGSSGSNVLSGEAGNDKLNGGRGSDVLIGGAGKDTLIGGRDADIFRFSSVADSKVGNSRDVVSDFQRGDKIDLSSIDAGTAAGDQAFTAVALGSSTPTSLAAGTLFYNTRTKVLSGEVTGDGKADFEIQVAGPTRLVLTLADFIL